MSYKIAIGGMHIESSTFTSYISIKKDFKIRRGQELLNYYPWLKDNAYDVDCIPLVHARALPGGVVSKAFYKEWLEKFTSLLKKSITDHNLDGVLLDLHGAMSVEGILDAEGIICEHIRSIVGAKVIISTTMDLHGNVSDKLFNASDLLACFRTAPHMDEDSTKERDFYNLIKGINLGRNNLVKTKVDVPILLPGEKTSTEVEPGKSLYAELNEVCHKKEVIDAAIWMGFPWADEARCHSVVVITGTNSTIVKKQAEELALKFWN
jgi:microcystin degradation protein MlrC